MIEKIKNSSLTFKIGALTFFVAVMVIISTSFLLVVQYNNAIMKRASSNIREYTKVMSERISSIFNDGILCTNNVMLSINSISTDHDLTETERERNILGILNQNVLIFPGVSTVIYIDENEKMYVTNEGQREKKEEILSSGYITQLDENGGKTEVLNAADECMTVGNQKYITLGKKIRNINTGKALGYVFVNMEEEYVMNCSQNDLSEYLLADGQGNYVTGGIEEEKDTEKIIEQLISDDTLTEIKIENDKYLVDRQYMDTYQWELIGITNVNRHNLSRLELLSILAVTSLIGMGLCILAMKISSKFIAKPIRKLNDGARKIAEGDSKYRFSFQTNDELGRFARTFNYMLDKNEQLVARVNEQAKEKSRYELSLLQEQIKPHFLYNTLDIIVMLIQMQREKEAERVTRKLAAYYKNCLSGSEEIITLEREIQIIRDYLDLQMMRYGEKFVFDIHVSGEMYDILIPKLTLQPIVENAIYHGIKEKPGTGHIRIYGKTDAERKTVELVIEDDGAGMDDAVLAHVQKQLAGNTGGQRQSDRDEDKKSGFGIYNTNNRIRLYYGEPYGISIESALWEGTKVTVCLPQKRVLE